MVKPRENRVPIMMSDDELKAIDDWRFANRIATRSQAVRLLCKTAFVAVPPLLSEYDLADDAVGRIADVEKAILDALELTNRGAAEEAGKRLDAAFAQALDLSEVLENLRLTLSAAFVKINDLVDAPSIAEGVKAVSDRSEEITKYFGEIRDRYEELRKS